MELTMGVQGQILEIVPTLLLVKIKLNILSPSKVA